MEYSEYQQSVVIAVLGSTGTGKSKLGIELAEEFNGEIISADSIQVYSGLDICSAKVTAEEQAQAKHHLLGVAECTESYDVVQFRDAAMPIISDILARGKVPIIVGGTNYYIEALLWQTLMPKQDNEQQSSTATAMSIGSMASSTSSCQVSGSGEAEQRHEQAVPANSACVAAAQASGGSSRPAAASAAGSLYERLQKVDPEMAARLHPNNVRKIQRSLEVYEQHGVPQSRLLAQQHGGSADATQHGTQLRFPKACAFWIKCDTDVLDKRLKGRVDGMVEQGMMEELESFHSQYGQHCLQPDGQPCFEHGLFQSIGYKELHPYLTRAADTGPQDADALRQRCLESLVTATCRYSRKQSTWVRNRFLKAGGHKVPLYGLDSSKPENWLHDVLQPAKDIVTAHLADSPSPIQPLALLQASKETWQKHECDVCNRTLHGDHEWKVHLQSRVHRRHQKRYQKHQRKDSVQPSLNRGDPVEDARDEPETQ